MYSDIMCAIMLQNYVTPWFESSIGIRQGDCLSPTVFTLFINDLAQDLKCNHRGVNIGEYSWCVLLYADDITLIADNEEEMQAVLNRDDSWCRKWRLMVNQKSQILHFRPKSHKMTNYLFKFGQVELSVVHQYKYLGVTFDEFCNFYIAGRRILATARGRALGKIYCIKRKLSGVGFKTFTKLFESYIDPIVTYASSVWGLRYFFFPDATQNRAVRMFLGVHRFAPNKAINGDIG